jgi:hypothetical protein
MTNTTAAAGKIQHALVKARLFAIMERLRVKKYTNPGGKLKLKFHLNEQISLIFKGHQDCSHFESERLFRASKL